LKKLLAQSYSEQSCTGLVMEDQCSSWWHKYVWHIQNLYQLYIQSTLLYYHYYCLRSVSSSLLKFTRFIQGNNIAWTNLDISGIYNTCIWIRSPIPIKHYFLIDIDFFSKLKVSCGPSNNNHCKLLMANVLQWKQGPMLIRRLWWVSPKSLYTHIPKKQVNISKYSKKKRWLLNIWP
jgi:hypothetical protein